MFNMTPTNTLIDDAVRMLHNSYPQPAMDYDGLTRILCRTDCPPGIPGAIFNATCNQYALAGGKFDHAGDPEDFDLFVEKNLAIHNLVIDQYNRKDV